MLKLSCEYNSKTINVKFNDQLTASSYLHGVSAKDGMGIVRALQDAASKNSGKNIFDQKFDLVVRDVKLVEKLREILKSVRTANSSYKIASNLRDEMSGFVSGLFYFGKDKDRFSLAEQYVLNDLTGCLYYGPSMHDTIELYDAANRDRSNLLAKYDELLSFPYEKYTEDSIKLVDLIQEKRKECLVRIDAFESILDKAGEDLINWSQHKISRTLNTSSTGLSYYSISSWIQEAQEKMRDSGLRPKTKTKGVSRKEVLEKKFNEDPSSVTQEELLTLFKQTNLNCKVVNLMDYSTLVELMQSDLKVVKDKLSERWRGLDEAGLSILNRACDIGPKTIEDFKIIQVFASSNRTDLSWEYLYSVQDFLNTDLVLDIASRNKTMGEIPSEFYDKFLSEVPVKKLLSVNQTISYEFVSRLNDEDKVGVLPRLLGKYIRKADTNAVNFLLRQEWYDDIDYVYFSKDNLFKLYKDIPWNKIKGEILENAVFESVDFILQNKDKESALLLLTTEKEGRLNGDRKKELVSMFDEETQLKLVIENPKTFKDCFTQFILDESRLVAIFTAFIGKIDSHGFTLSVARRFEYNKLDSNKLKEALLNKKEFTFLQLDSSLMKLLDKKVKIHILKSGEILEPNNSGNYSVRSNGFDHHLMEFFKGFTREELLKSLGDLTESRYSIYLAHYMTIEERVKISERDLLFTRINLEFLPYDYLKKYENKKLFKDLVGDRRNSTNDYFAKRLEQRLQDKLNPSNTIKMMYS
jgi:hypothetical protein